MIVNITGLNIEIAPIEHHLCGSSYTEAVMYCNFFQLNNQNNWRMPTIDELQAIYEIHAAGELLLQPSAPYWSSTPNMVKSNEMLILLTRVGNIIGCATNYSKWMQCVPIREVD